MTSVGDASSFQDWLDATKGKLRIRNNTSTEPTEVMTTSREGPRLTVVAFAENKVCS